MRNLDSSAKMEHVKFLQCDILLPLDSFKKSKLKYSGSLFYFSNNAIKIEGEYDPLENVLKNKGSITKPIKNSGIF